MDPNVSTQLYIESLGFYGARASEYQKFLNDFTRLTQSETVPLTLAQFKVDCYAKGYNSKQATVFYTVVDRDNGGSIDRYEYALFRATITDYYAARDQHFPILNFIRLVMIFRMYDFDGSNSLEYDELRVMVQDLVKGDHLVNSILAMMGVNAGTQVSLGSFVCDQVQQVFQKFNLFSGELLSPGTDVGMTHESEQLVFVDPRVISTGTNIITPMSPGAVSAESFSAHYKVDQKMLCSNNWRGLLVNVECDAFQLAKVIVENAHEIANDCVDFPDDMTDNAWMTGNECLFALTGQTDLGVCASYMKTLAEECKRLVSSQDTVISMCAAPVKVFGDIHGQLKDVLNLFRHFGFPSNLGGGDIESLRYIFTGNYVDYGSHQVETMMLLMALKVAFPGHVYLLRGSHECKSQNASTTSQGSLGFDSSCSRHFGATNGGVVYDAVQDVFQWLPLAAVVAKSILVCHGGIGQGDWTIDQLKSASASLRPLPEMFPITTAAGGYVANILWSDPMPPPNVGDMQTELEESPRGPGLYTFSEAVTKRFCNTNRLHMIIRAHELPTEGYEIHHQGLLWTVASCRSAGKAATMMLIATTEEGKLLVRPKSISKLPAAV